MSIYSYKCPNCSGDLLYNPNQEKMVCEYCDSIFTKEEIDKYLKDNPDKINIEKKEDVNKNTIEKDYAENSFKGYICQNCAAEVVTDNTTMTTFCYYCHSPVVLTNKVSGNFKPDYVIPFKYDKKEAENKFLKWAKSKRYVVKDFYSSSSLEKITGMYLPYWNLNVKVNVDIEAIGYNQESTTSGNYIHTTKSSYKILRDGDFEINNISELAYTKINKEQIDSITPYDFKEINDFSPFYLNGFFSESYDLKIEDVKNNAEKRLENYKEHKIDDLYDNYQSYEKIKEEVKELDRNWKYILLPTWILTYDYKGKKYIYTMNGQTGNSYGELPIDNKLIIKDAFKIAIVIFILTLLGGYFIW